MTKSFNRMTAGEQVAQIARQSALAGEDRPQLKSDNLQAVSDKAFNDALEDWAEKNAAAVDSFCDGPEY